MNAPLLPCPFCGSDAELSEEQGESLFSHNIVDWYIPRCTNPIANITDEQPLDCPAHAGVPDEDRDVAIANWNRRLVAMVPGRWFRIIDPERSVIWMETSDEAEARAESTKTGWPLERLWQVRFTEWRTVAPEEIG